MTREEILNELKARNKRRAKLHEELLSAELNREDADPLRTALDNNALRMDELFAMLSRLDINTPDAGAA